MNKREFLRMSGAAGITASLPVTALSASSLNELEDITSDAVPIGVEERRTRVAKAQRLMREQDVDALILEAGSALV